MNKDPKFYICNHCKNLVQMVHDAGVKMICCGEPMSEIVPNTTDAATEKHLPIINVNDSTVTVEIGSTMHPMLEEHHIGWIYLQTEKGGQCKMLNAGETPKAAFELVEDQPLAAYAYCNLHGLWKTEIK